jgi:hypothetical protein
MTMKQIHTFAHCRQCAMRGRRQDLEAGLTHDGIQLWCRRCDKEVARFTPDSLAKAMALGPRCECCPGGMHRN